MSSIVVSEARQLKVSELRKKLEGNAQKQESISFESLERLLNTVRPKLANIFGTIGDAFQNFDKSQTGSITLGNFLDGLRRSVKEIDWVAQNSAVRELWKQYSACSGEMSLGQFKLMLGPSDRWAAARSNTLQTGAKSSITHLTTNNILQTPETHKIQAVWANSGVKHPDVYAGARYHKAMLLKGQIATPASSGGETPQELQGLLGRLGLLSPEPAGYTPYKSGEKPQRSGRLLGDILGGCSIADMPVLDDSTLGKQNKYEGVFGKQIFEESCVFAKQDVSAWLDTSVNESAKEAKLQIVLPQEKKEGSEAKDLHLTLPQLDENDVAETNDLSCISTAHVSMFTPTGALLLPRLPNSELSNLKSEGESSGCNGLSKTCELSNVVELSSDSKAGEFSGSNVLSKTTYLKKVSTELKKNMSNELKKKAKSAIDIGTGPDSPVEKPVPTLPMCVDSACGSDSPIDDPLKKSLNTSKGLNITGCVDMACGAEEIKTEEFEAEEVHTVAVGLEIGKASCENLEKEDTEEANVSIQSCVMTKESVNTKTVETGDENENTPHENGEATNMSVQVDLVTVDTQSAPLTTQGLLTTHDANLAENKTEQPKTEIEIAGSEMLIPQKGSLKASLEESVSQGNEIGVQTNPFSSLTLENLENVAVQVVPEGDVVTITKAPVAEKESPVLQHIITNVQQIANESTQHTLESQKTGPPTLIESEDEKKTPEIIKLTPIITKVEPQETTPILKATPIVEKQLYDIVEQGTPVEEKTTPVIIEKTTPVVIVETPVVQFTGSILENETLPSIHEESNADCEKSFDYKRKPPKGAPVRLETAGESRRSRLTLPAKSSAFPSSQSLTMTPSSVTDSLPDKQLDKCWTPNTLMPSVRRYSLATGTNSNPSSVTRYVVSPNVMSPTRHNVQGSFNRRASSGVYRIIHQYERPQQAPPVMDRVNTPQQSLCTAQPLSSVPHKNNSLSTINAISNVPGSIPQVNAKVGQLSNGNILQPKHIVQYSNSNSRPSQGRYSYIKQ
eukprot:Platyproteum_vivax@DN7133_c0_g1_i1.p1